MGSRPNSSPEYHALLDLSARLGADPLRTQAAGGNTSLKLGDILWIKASGTWLADAERRDIMVPVRLGALRAALAAGDQRARTGVDFVVRDLNPAGLRPSVETPVHAVMRWPVVVHIHCVATVAAAVRADADKTVLERLAPVPGARFAVLPYIRPGVPLAAAIAALDPRTNVIILGNHGLVVGAPTVAAADELIESVVSAFAVSRRPSPPADLQALRSLAEGTPYRLPLRPETHDVATDSASLSLATGGTLYPDHVVFLGPGILVPEADQSPVTILRRAIAAGRPPPPMLVYRDKGVLLHRSVLRGSDELARNLAEVAARVPAGTKVNYLPTDEERALVDWEAEAYRRSVAGAALSQ